MSSTHLLLEILQKNAVYSSSTYFLVSLSPKSKKPVRNVVYKSITSSCKNTALEVWASAKGKIARFCSWTFTYHFLSSLLLLLLSPLFSFVGHLLGIISLKNPGIVKFLRNSGGTRFSLEFSV